MAYQIDNAGYEVDGFKFDLWVPTITEEALQLAQQEEAKKTLGKCASCKTWFSRVSELALWVDYDEIKVEVCPNCAEDYYPEAVTI
jgi:hypothetical protein